MGRYRVETDQWVDEAERFATTVMLGATEMSDDDRNLMHTLLTLAYIKGALMAELHMRENGKR